jgi:hypothetical protein
MQDMEMTQSVIEAQIEKSFLKDVQSQTDKLKTVSDQPTVGEEVKFLRRMVHKLNVELSKCRNEESDVLDGETPPNWTHDLRRLAPLVLAFEEEVNSHHFIHLKSINFVPCKSTKIDQA